MLDVDRLLYQLARDIVWFRNIKIPKTDPPEFKQVYAHPPAVIARDMLAAKTFPFPVLRRIIETPAFSANGTLQATPGYHPATQAYYAPVDGLTDLSIPDYPTVQQVKDAVSLIFDEAFEGFPFEGQSDKAHALAMLLLHFVRDAIDGPTPLHLPSKPRAGTGASLLVEAVAHITTGREAQTMTECSSEEEWAKTLTSTLRMLPTLITIDNIRGRLDSAKLSSALTSRVYQNRILGESRNLSVPVRCVWVATGNNPALSSEITRRSIPIRLDAKVERPQIGRTFKYPFLIPWIRQHHSELVTACLTIVRAWFVQGKPAFGGSMMLGSYEDWTRVMGGILDVAEVDGFLGNLVPFLDTNDTEGGQIRAFVERWWDDHRSEPVVVKEMIQAASDIGIYLGKTDSERSAVTTLGIWMGRLKDQHFDLEGGATVRVVGLKADTKTKAARWQLSLVEKSEPSEHSERYKAQREEEKIETPIPPDVFYGAEREGERSECSEGSATRYYTHPSCGTQVPWGEDCPVCNPQEAA